MKDNIKPQFTSVQLVQRKTIPAGDRLPESLDDWEREVRREERTGSPSTILPLISSLLTSCHCSSRLLSPLLQTLLNTINQPNPSSHSGSEEFPLMPQSEVLLDLLDLTGEDFKSENWGPSVTALIMRLRATALASMILQVIKNINVLNRTITCLHNQRMTGLGSLGSSPNTSATLYKTQRSSYKTISKFFNTLNF